MRIAAQKETEDTESSSTSCDTSDDEFWDWYTSEQREFDSFQFPPGYFTSCLGEASEEFEPAADGFETLPRRGHESQTHCWDDADTAGVLVRSRGYLKNQVKEQTRSPMLELRHVDLFSAPTSYEHYSASSSSAVARLRKEGEERFLFVLNFRLHPLQLTITWAAPSSPPWKTDPAGQLFHSFCKAMTDDERNTRLKLLPKVMEGPWYITAALPPKPVLIGRQCPITYFAGDQYIEASIDCTSSGLGRKLTQLLTAGTCVVALFVIMEGKTEEELPERLLGGAAVHRTQADRISVR